MGGVSLNPENMTEGGGLLDDCEVTFNKCRFSMFDYGGKVDIKAPALMIEMEPDEGEEVKQYWTMGKPTDWKPSENGKELIAIGKASAISLSSNGGIFLASLIEAGFPSDQLDDDISVLDGLVAHVVRVPAPERKGLKGGKNRDYEATILTVQEIIKLPWEEKESGAAKEKRKTDKKSGGGKKADKKASKKDDKKASKKGGDEDVNEEAIGAILSVLAEASDGSVSIRRLPADLFKALKENGNRNAILKLAADEEWLSDREEFLFDGTNVSLPE